MKMVKTYSYDGFTISHGKPNVVYMNFDLLEEFERLIAEGVFDTCPTCKCQYVTRPLFTSIWIGCDSCGKSKKKLELEGLKDDK